MWPYPVGSKGARDVSVSVYHSLVQKKMKDLVISKPGMVAHTSNPSIKEAEAGGSL